MDLNAEKIKIIKKLLTVEDELLLAAVQKLLNHGRKNKGKEFWNELTDAQIKQIEKSRAQHKAGEGIPHNEVMAEFRKKYSSWVCSKLFSCINFNAPQKPGWFRLPPQQKSTKFIIFVDNFNWFYGNFNF